MLSRSLGHRAPLLWLVLPYAAGLVAGRLAGNPAPLWTLGVAAVILVAGGVADRRWRGLWAPALVSALVLAGTASYALNRSWLPDWRELPPREAELELRVNRVFPAVAADRVTGLATVTGTAPHLHRLRGQKLYFSLRQSGPADPVLRSTRLRALGVLELLPDRPEPLSFDAYLADAGMNYRLTRGRVLATTRAATAYYRFCDRMLVRFSATLGVGVETKRPELSGILRAMLLGQKQALNETQDRLFRLSGTMHLFAISGLHIGVIALGLHALFSLLRLPRPVLFVTSLTVLWLYVDITGAAPSAVRAFIMVAAFQSAQLFRRPGNPLAALALSATVVLLFAPMQLFSASFQMSYSIVAAILLLGLPLADWLQQRWQPFAWLPETARKIHHRILAGAWRSGLVTVAIGLASSLISALTGIWYFQLFTPGALLANLLLIPAASFVILGGTTSLLCGLAGFTAGSWFCNHATGAVLLAIGHAVRLLVELPLMYWPAAFRAEWIGPLGLAAVIAAMLAAYARGFGYAALRWSLPVLVLALTLIFGVKFGGSP